MSRVEAAHPRRRHRQPTLGNAIWGAAATVALLALGLGRRDPTDDREAAAADSERGRDANHPHEIPARGWKDILKRVYASISSDRVLAIAAGVTFYTLLAIFPAIAALVSIYGLLADTAAITEHLQALTGFMPEGAVEIIREQIMRVSAAGGGALSVALFISVAISLWSANAGMKALFDALNVVYGEQEKRGFVRLNAISLAFTFGAILFIILTLIAAVVMPVVVQFVGLPRSTQQWLSLLPWPVLFLAIVFALGLIYRHGPSRQDARWQWLSWGSVLAALLWLAASVGFSWYTANFGSYNETYGSLGAAIGFMMWIWISTIVILLGAELNAEIEHQTARDSTTGPGKPMGKRGAFVADTVPGE